MTSVPTATPTGPARPLLVVVTGATASGKTSLAIGLAQRLGCAIVGADSRQLYRDLPITTAAPTAAERAAAEHRLVGILPLDAPYSAARYEADALHELDGLWSRQQARGQRQVAVMCGGSAMYVDAVCRGLDSLPEVSPQVRHDVWQLYEAEGLEGLQQAVRFADPDYMARCADPLNHRRLIHALEVTRMAGQPYSSLLTGQARQRGFDILKVAVDMDRATLFRRINARAEAMVALGMADEVRAVAHLRHLNAMNTVGVKEMLRYIDGDWTLPFALARLQKNTRVYAKKQLTWLRRDPSVVWLEHNGAPGVLIDKVTELAAAHLH